MALDYRAGSSKARASSPDGQLPGKAATACEADGEHDGRAGAHERAVDGAVAHRTAGTAGDCATICCAKLRNTKVGFTIIGTWCKQDQM